MYTLVSIYAIDSDLSHFWPIAGAYHRNCRNRRFTPDVLISLWNTFAILPSGLMMERMFRLIITEFWVFLVS